MFNQSFPKVGVIGLGIIGSRVADSLRRSGKHVYVWNRSPKTEPNFLGSPAEVVETSEAVQIFVTDGEALLDVVQAMESSLTSDHILLNHATADVDSVRKAADIAYSAGARFLDCPFTGSKQAAEDNSLVYYVGGDTELLEYVRPLLKVTSQHIQHVGEVGEASILKLATNMISATTIQALCEALAVVQSNGVAGERLIDAILVNGNCSELAKSKLPTMISQDFAPHFSLKNMFKDAQLALGLANATDVDVPALSTTASIMFKTIQKGHGDEDFTVIAKNYDPEEKDA